MKPLTLAITFVIYITVTMAYAFHQSLPHWCANPNVGGNHIVQPFCKSV